MSEVTTEELERRIAFLSGEISSLSIAVHALLKHHPHRNAVAVEIHQGYEQMASRFLARPFPDALVDGMKSCRDTYLLKPDKDPNL